MQSTMLLSVCLVLTLSAIGPLAAECPFEAPTQDNMGACDCVNATHIVCTGADDKSYLPDKKSVTFSQEHLVIKMKSFSNIGEKTLPPGFKSLICDTCNGLRAIMAGGFDGSKDSLLFLRVKQSPSVVDLYLDGMGELTALEELHWTNGDLDTVEVFNEIVSLKKLYLTSNKLTSVPDMTKLTNLIDLNLKDNEISDLSIFPKTLTTINLEYNNIKTIPNIEFTEDTNNLQYLYLYGNPVTSVESDAFKQLTKLKSLRLSLKTNIPAALNSLTNLNNINDITGNFACKCNGAIAGKDAVAYAVEPPTGCKKNCHTATAPPGVESVGYSIVYSNSVLFFFVCMTVCWYNYLGT